MKVLIALLTTSTLAAAQRVVSMGISKPSSQLPQLRRRAASTYTEVLVNNASAGGYYADVTVGTPPQKVTLVIDTGSSDVWLLSSSASLCTESQLEEQFGSCLSTYDKDGSSSYNALTTRFQITYADGSGAQGIYMKDNFTIGGATLSQLEMGLGVEATITSGLIGLGYDTNEAATRIYPNILDVFQSQGLIGTKAYSLYLNDLESSTGTILFGGVDTEKYIGNLIAVPVEPDAHSGSITSFTVSLSSITMTNGSGSPSTFSSQDFPVPVILDSGTTLTYLPTDVTQSLFSKFKAYDDTGRSGTGLVFVDCGYLGQNITLSFQFGGTDGPIVQVPIDEIVLDNVKSAVAAGYSIPTLPFTDVCSFGIQAGSNIFLLGDTFLRSAYVVYDITNNQVALAQANLNSTNTNIVEIKSGATEIPNVTGVASQVTVAQTATGIPGKGGDGSNTVVTVTAGASTSASATTSGNAGARSVPAPDWEAAGVAAIAGVGMLVGTMLFVV